MQLLGGNYLASIEITLESFQDSLPALDRVWVKCEMERSGRSCSTLSQERTSSSHRGCLSKSDQTSNR